MTVVALCIEMGACDDRFGGRLADTLGLKIVDLREIEREAAQRSDHAGTLVRRCVVGRLPWSKTWSHTPNELSDQMSELALESAACGGAVIVGWGAAAVLRSVSHVVRVRLFAPPFWREQAVAKRLCFPDPRSARYEIDSMDGLLVRFVRRVADVDWRDPSLYHLELNVAAMTDEACFQLIGSVCALPQFQSTCERSADLKNRLARFRQSAAAPIDGGAGCGCVVLGSGDALSISAGTSHEEAIAKIEQHLHGKRPL